MSILDGVEDLINAQLCLRRTRVHSFTASPPALAPGSDSTVLSWDVDVDQSCGSVLGITLADASVAASGSRTVRQSTTRTYVLKGRVRTVEATLGVLTVPFDLSSCMSFEIAESVIQQVTQAAIRDLVAAEDGISLDDDPVVETGPDGVSVSIDATKALTGLPDLEIDVDCTIAIAVEDGQPTIRITSFSVDTDFAGVFTVLTGGASKLVEEVIDEFAERRLKSRIRSAVGSLVDSFVGFVDPLRLHAIESTDVGIRITACPTEDDTEDAPVVAGRPGDSRVVR